MLRVRFLQLSDLHFGAPMTASRLNLPPEKQAQRRQEFENLIRGLSKTVADTEVNAVLIPGDLWDHEHVDHHQLEAFRLLYGELCNLPVPVIIAPGNHDFYSTSSFYHPETLKTHGFAPWPSHIHIFTEPAFKTVWLPGWEGHVQVTGCAFQDNTQLALDNSLRQQRLLAGLSSREATSALDLLLFHGARDDFNRFENKITAPFSQQELLALQFDYAAIGHYHRFDAFTNAMGGVKGAYAGSPFARGLDETGPKLALVVEAVKEGTDPARITLEKWPLDSRQIVHRHVTITGVDGLEALEALILADLNAHARPEDIVFCELHGQLPPDITPSWEPLEVLLNRHYFHVTLYTAEVAAAYDLARLRDDPYALEGRFIREMEERQAMASGDEKALLEKALYLGLDALTGSRMRTP